MKNTLLSTRKWAPRWMGGETAHASPACLSCIYFQGTPRPPASPSHWPCPVHTQPRVLGCSGCPLPHLPGVLPAGSRDGSEAAGPRAGTWVSTHLSFASGLVKNRDSSWEEDPSLHCTGGRDWRKREAPQARPEPLVPIGDCV